MLYDAALRALFSAPDLWQAMHSAQRCASTEIAMPTDEQPPFAHFMGIKVTLVTPDRVEAELEVRAELGNRNGVLHGGAVMALADNLGGTGTMANLPDGASTATIESKTNFFLGIPVGDTARAECTPLHRGRTTMVWQTRIMRGDGRLAALVTQTQLVMAGRT
jgi:uncharacterized protein (TIGR00369 family)